MTPRSPGKSAAFLLGNRPRHGCVLHGDGDARRPDGQRRLRLPLCLEGWEGLLDCESSLSRICLILPSAAAAPSMTCGERPTSGRRLMTSKCLPAS